MNESYAQMAKAQRQRPLRKMPYVVISHGMHEESIEKATEPAWQQAQIKLAKLVPGGKRIVANTSDHAIPAEQPGLIVDTIRGVLASASGNAKTPKQRRLKLRAALDALQAAGSPGVIVLVRDGSQTIRLADGYAQLATKTRMTANTRFRIGSVTKTFVATVALQLVGEGKLSLDDTVEDWLPGLVPNGRNITVRELLNHTSGLAEFTSPALEAKIVRNPTKPWSPQQLIALSTAQMPNFAPGARNHWAYSNTNYVLVGLIIEKATGRTLRKELQRRIFTPLALTKTTFDSEPVIKGPHAHGYAILGNGQVQDVNVVTPTWAWAAGAIVSTVDDLARFERALLRGRLLRPAQLHAMQTTVAMGPADRYGLGLWKTETLSSSPGFRLPCRAVWGHNGDFPGYTTDAFSSKDGGRQMIVFADTDHYTASFTKALGYLTATAYCG